MKSLFDQVGNMEFTNTIYLLSSLIASQKIELNCERRGKGGEVSKEASQRLIYVTKMYCK